MSYEALMARSLAVVIRLLCVIAANQRTKNKEETADERYAQRWAVQLDAESSKGMPKVGG